jgi:hypothetical protein
VTFKHRGFLQATMKPKLPALHRIRTDLTWDDVLRNWKEHNYAATGMTFTLPGTSMLTCVFLSSSCDAASFTPLGSTEPQTSKHTSPWYDITARQNFFKEVAAELGFPHTSAEHWQHVTAAQVIAKKGRGPLSLFHGSLPQALAETFPTMEFKGESPTTLPPSSLSPLSQRRAAQPRVKGYWRHIENRRKFFERFAAEQGFDPTDAQRWKDVTVAQVWEKKVRKRLCCSSLLFVSLPVHSHIASCIQGFGVLSIFKGSLTQALRQTYPDLKL